MTLAKSKTGETGSTAKTLSLTSDSQVFSFLSASSNDAIDNDIIFSINQQNLSGTIGSSDITISTAGGNVTGFSLDTNSVTNGTGIVDMVFYYTDTDDTSLTLQNVTHIATIQVDCTVTQTAVSFSHTVNPLVVIPTGKKIFAFIRNTGYDANERLRMTMLYQYTSKVSSSSSYTLSR